MGKWGFCFGSIFEEPKQIRSMELRQVVFVCLRPCHRGQSRVKNVFCVENHVCKSTEWGERDGCRFGTEKGCC